MDFREITEFMKDSLGIIITVLVVFFLFIFVIGLQQVVGPSMEPNYHEGDVVVLNKFIYNFRKPKRGEVVVVTQNEKYMIKRVIGLPGDKVEFINNKLYINDQEYSESYLNEDTITDDFSITSFGVDKIPDDKYLVLGDNRGDSLDSRKYGFIDKKNITGKVWFKIFHFKN